MSLSRPVCSIEQSVILLERGAGGGGHQGEQGDGLGHHDGDGGG